MICVGMDLSGSLSQAIVTLADSKFVHHKFPCFTSYCQRGARDPSQTYIVWRKENDQARPSCLIGTLKSMALLRYILLRDEPPRLGVRERHETTRAT